MSARYFDGSDGHGGCHAGSYNGLDSHFRGMTKFIGSVLIKDDGQTSN